MAVGFGDGCGDMLGGGEGTCDGCCVCVGAGEGCLVLVVGMCVTVG